MGNKFARSALAGVLFALVASVAAAQVSVSIGFFHDTLAPHGRWVATSSYGDCWVPSGVAAGWAPYVDGEWQWTDYGWTWASSDPWGDIAYHYGTWVWSPPYGWVWVPGTVWAPSWVTWAYTDDYIGWAPVPVSFAVTAGGYVGPPVVVSRTSYVFVPSRQFAGVQVASVRVPVAQTSAIYARAQRVTAFPVQGGVVHNTGLPVARVEKMTGHRIEAARVDPEKLRVAPIPKGQAKSFRVVAPATERAAAIRKSGGPQKAEPNAREARPPAAESQARHEAQPKKPAVDARPEPQARHEAKPKKPAAETRPAPEPQARHEAQPKKPPVETRPEPQARHEAKPKKPAPERPAAEPQAEPRDNAPREAAAEPPHPAPHAAPKADQRAQHGNPHPETKAKPQPQHGNNAKPQHDEPGKPNRD